MEFLDFLCALHCWRFAPQNVFEHHIEHNLYSVKLRLSQCSTAKQLQDKLNMLPYYTDLKADLNNPQPFSLRPPARQEYQTAWNPWKFVNMKEKTQALRWFSFSRCMVEELKYSRGFLKHFPACDLINLFLLPLAEDHEEESQLLSREWWNWEWEPNWASNHRPRVSEICGEEMYWTD